MPYTYQFFLDNPEVFSSIKTDAWITFTCSGCQQNYDRTKRSVYSAIKRWNAKRNFCSKVCQGLFEREKINEPCQNCGASVSRVPSARRKVKAVFCTKSCAATYNNKHKTHGTRRSKLEAHIEDLIRLDYPQLEVVCNGKDAIGSELDFYFPQLRFAIELNGPTHYEPIYGQKKFEQIQKNDKQKFIGCYRLGVELMVVDVSTCKYLTKGKRAHFYSLIKTQIDSLLGRLET